MSLRTTLGATTMLAALLLCTPASALTITGASFEADFAELVADKCVGATNTGDHCPDGIQANSLILSGPNGENPLDLTDLFFGTSDAIFGGTPNINLQAGSGQTHVYSVPIPSSFFPVLANKLVRVQLLVTDTQDNLFAMDYVALNVQTTEGVLQAVIGANNGYLNSFTQNIPGFPVPDNGNLPGTPGSIVLTDLLPPGTTNTGFDESISSKNLEVVLHVPEPATLFLVIVGLGWMIAFGRRRASRLSRELTLDYGGWRQP